MDRDASPDEVFNQLQIAGAIAGPQVKKIFPDWLVELFASTFVLLYLEQTLWALGQSWGESFSLKSRWAQCDR
jgi:hypothetical protein